MKFILWTLFVVLILLMGHQSCVVHRLGTYDIASLEFADITKGKVMMACWASIKYGEGTLLDTVRSNAHWDFLFIAVYVSLLLLLSYLQMQRERWIILNELLRLSLLLALLAGICDLIGNTVLLYNIQHWADAGIYYNSYWLSWIKWILIAWMVLVWLSSLIKKVAQE